MAALVRTKTPHSKTWTFFDGEWVEGNVAIMGPRTHGSWQASAVFDGGRVFEGVAPDIDQHFQRVNRSATGLGLRPVTSHETWMELLEDGVKRFSGDVALYVRPMYWAVTGIGGGVMVDPDSTDWCLCLHEAPLPPPNGMSVTLSPYRRPTPESAVLEAKAGANYPNGARALAEAKTRGFDNAIMLDMLGAVTELANANVMLVKDGVVRTAYPNGTFLNGVTRQRVIGLLRGEGHVVEEATLTYADFLDADEIFTTGNFNKVAPVTQIEDRTLQMGPVCRKARELYWDFAHSR